jgi:methyl-accepting chemotaxis protein
LFTEILRIRPVLDRANAAAMERNLNQRFGRVARRFGQGLRNVVRGTVLGMSLAFLTRLLNPIKALEDRIKSALGQADEIRDLADEFGTTPGQLQRLQSAGHSLGVSPDQLRDMMRSFAASIETGREEVKEGKELSATTHMVKNFLGDQDMAESFFAFLASLRSASPEVRKEVEKGVFGGRQHGAARRLIDTNLTQQMNVIGAPSVARLNTALNNMADLEAQRRVLEAKRINENIIGSELRIEPEMIEAMENAEFNQTKRDNLALEGYERLRQVADDVQVLRDTLETISKYVVEGLGFLGRTIKWLEGFSFSRAAKGYLKDVGGRN